VVVPEERKRHRREAGNHYCRRQNQTPAVALISRFEKYPGAQRRAELDGLCACRPWTKFPTKLVTNYKLATLKSAEPHFLSQ
jgi:hypothetical protein